LRLPVEEEEHEGTKFTETHGGPLELFAGPPAFGRPPEVVEIPRYECHLVGAALVPADLHHLPPREARRREQPLTASCLSA